MSSRQACKTARQNGAVAAGTTSHKVVEPPKQDVNVLCNESPSNFERHKNLYYEKFQPKGQVEIDLVEDMVAACWRIGRIRYLKSAAMDLEMDRQADEIEESFDGIDEPTRALLAFSKLANTEAILVLLLRHENSYARMYDLRDREANQNLRNDPKPAEKTPLPPLSEHRGLASHQNLRNDPKPAERAPLPHREQASHQILRNDPNPPQLVPEPLQFATVTERPRRPEHREPTPKT